MNPRPKSTVERLQTLLQGDSRPVQTPNGGAPLSVGYANAHPRLSPVGLRLRVHVLSGRTCILDFCERLYPEGGCNAPLHLGFALHSTVIGITLAEGANMRR